MKTCNKCGKKDLSWNVSWHQHSGKWQLINHKNKDGEWCVNNSLKPKENKLTKKDTAPTILILPINGTSKYLTCIIYFLKSS